MKKTSVFACLVLTISAATSIRAHHSFSMFDASKEEVVVGDVVRWAFNSPHTALYLRDAKGITWGFEGAAPPALVGRNPKIDGFTFKPGDRVTMIHCPLGDGRNGGAIGLVMTKDGTWYNPADGGCRAGASQENWKKWLEAGYTSRAQAEAAKK
jgi:uncharacterized protein DUF6152